MFKMSGLTIKTNKNTKSSDSMRQKTRCKKNK